MNWRHDFLILFILAAIFLNLFNPIHGFLARTDSIFNGITSIFGVYVLPRFQIVFRDFQLLFVFCNFEVAIKHRFPPWENGFRSKSWSLFPWELGLRIQKGRNELPQDHPKPKLPPWELGFPLRLAALPVGAEPGDTRGEKRTTPGSSTAGVCATAHRVALDLKQGT